MRVRSGARMPMPSNEEMGSVIRAFGRTSKRRFLRLSLKGVFERRFSLRFFWESPWSVFARTKDKLPHESGDN